MTLTGDLDLTPSVADGKHPVLHPCPRCGGECELSAGRLVYPKDQDWFERMALVCWRCWVVRRRSEAWTLIDRKRHERQWKSENKRNKDDDRVWDG